MDFNYKKYSLEKLETWVEDALNSAEASPQEIYDCIRKVVEDNYYYYKNSTSRCYELLCLLNGNGKGHIPAYDEYVEKKENLVCDKDNPSLECQKSWNDFWEENYYPEEYKVSTTSNADLQKEVEEIRKEGGYDWTPPTNSEKSEHYYDYTRNDPNRENPFTTDIGTVVKNGVTHKEYLKAKIEANSAWNDGWTQKYYQDIVNKYEGKEDKVVKWSLPVEADPSGEYFVTFPDDLLETANLKEGDQVEWVDKGDGSYLLRKI
jgi:hypothetical protein